MHEMPIVLNVVRTLDHLVEELYGNLFEENTK